MDEVIAVRTQHPFLCRPDTSGGERDCSGGECEGACCGVVLSSQEEEDTPQV